MTSNTAHNYTHTHKWQCHTVQYLVKLVFVVVVVYILYLYLMKQWKKNEQFSRSQKTSSRTFLYNFQFNSETSFVCLWFHITWCILHFSTLNFLRTEKLNLVIFFVRKFRIDHKINVEFSDNRWPSIQDYRKFVFWFLLKWINFVCNFVPCRHATEYACGCYHPP